MSARILVVDDEVALLEGLAYALRREGFDVETVMRGEAAIDAARDGGFDLMLLDLMLPGISGVDVCREVRTFSGIPIIMLTAKDSEVDKVVGLEMGADDYVTKPFSALELVGRIRALLRRRDLDRQEAGEPARSVGDLTIDAARHEVSVGGRIVHLTPSEFKVLHVLARRPTEVVSKREILEDLWGTTHVPDEHACDVHMSNLRRKLEDDPSQPRRLVTVRGVGYKLVPV